MSFRACRSAAKLILIGFGLLNVLLVHRLNDWRQVVQGQPATIRLRFCATTSLLLWLTVIIAGRWVAFV